MTQVGEGRGTGGAGESTAFGVPAVGEILAERYQLEQHIDNDSAGRQIWRGVDVILRRPVAVILRHPGGAPASAMLQAAVEASRIVHPNLVGVYDAIDEGTRAYVVREWVEGVALRDHVLAEPFDPARATTVAHAVAAAVTAVHSTGMTHGNIHPGTVLIDTDGRVVLSDANADGPTSPEEDIRAVGAILYFALTGYWPHPEVAGPRSLPEAPRTPAGELTTPRAVRAGIPDYLDNLTMDLLDRRLTVPQAEVLAAEFARIDPQGEAYYLEAEPGYQDPGYQEPAPGPLRLTRERPDAPRPRTNWKVAAGVGALVVIGLLGLIVGVRMLSGSSESPTGPGAAPGATGSAGSESPAPSEAANQTPERIELSAAQVRIVDPPPGNRSEVDGSEAVVDGDVSTGWQTEGYTQPAFGNLKEGMGILINLGEPRRLASVTVELSASGASAELRTGDRDPGDTSDGDGEIVETYTRIGEPISRHSGTTMVFTGFDEDTEYQYLLVFITEMPPDPANPQRYRIGVQEVTVEGY